jgi:hypothetical protein
MRRTGFEIGPAWQITAEKPKRYWVFDDITTLLA